MSYDSVILADSPVAYWKLESLIPPSPAPNFECVDFANARNGSLFPNSVAGLIQGLAGPIITDAESYGSAGGIAFIPNPGFPDAALDLRGAQTWECWAINTGSGTETMLNRGGDASNTYLSYGQRSTGQFANNAFWIMTWPDTDTGLISCELELDVWHHVVVTYDGVSAMRMYVDSWLVASRDDAPPAPTEPEVVPWRLGYMTNFAFGAVSLSSGLSHVAVYDYDLTSEQVIAHNEAALGVRASNPCGPTTPTVGCPGAEGVVGEPYSSEVTVTGGTPPYSFAIISGALPDGLTLDPDTGAITGTPTTGGTFNFTVQVIDADLNTGESPGCQVIILSSPPEPPGPPPMQTFTFDEGGLGNEWFLAMQLSDSGIELRDKTMKSVRVTGKTTAAQVKGYGYGPQEDIDVSDIETGTGQRFAVALPDTTQVQQSRRFQVNVKNAMNHTVRVEGTWDGQGIRDRIDEIVYEVARQGVRR